MNNIAHNRIPDHPNETSATNVISRLIDGLVFRYFWSTEGLTENEYQFKPKNTDWDIAMLINHIHTLAHMVDRAFAGNLKVGKEGKTPEELRNETIKIYEDLSLRLRNMKDEELDACNFNHRSGKEFPFWNMLNGPLADALTHVGQINSWRRMAGNPLPKGVNFFSGVKMDV